MFTGQRLSVEEVIVDLKLTMHHLILRLALFSKTISLKTIVFIVGCLCTLLHFIQTSRFKAVNESIEI